MFISEDTAASPNDPEMMQDVEEGGSPSALLAAASSGSDVSFTGLYPSKAHGAELKIEVQPEPQHRSFILLVLVCALFAL